MSSQSRGSAASAAGSAATRIAERRERAEDPDLAHLTDELVGIVDYVRKHQRVPAEILRIDVVDAIEILDHLYDELDRLRLAVLRTGLHAGMTYQDLAGPLGVRTRQGAEAALRRLENAVAGGAKDEKAGRQDRRRQRQSAAWLAERSVEIRQLAVVLLAHRAQLPELAEDLDDLAADLATVPAGGMVSAGFAARIRLILREARAIGAPPPGLRATFDFAAELFATYPQAS